MTGQTHYWFDDLSLAGLFAFNESAPPPSRKLCEMPAPLPRLVDLSVPSK